MKTIAIVALLLTGAFTGVATAATRTVCLDLRFKDNRDSTFCALTSETGNRRGCSPGNDINHRGAIVELWDRDSDGTDELIGRFSYWFDGGTCWTFEWDNNSAANSEHEAHPDVYPKYVNEVFGPVNSRAVVAKTASGGAHPTVSWRDVSGIRVENCTTAGECWMAAGTYLVPSTDVNTTIAKRAMALDSAQHALEVFGGSLTSNINMEIPDSECGTSACAPSRSRIVVTDALSLSGLHVAHEIGHAFQMQRFARDTLRDDCSFGGASWSPTGVEHDSCATTEGFADYFGAASWYDGGVSGTVPLLEGLNYETATAENSTCSANRGIPIQATRSFWDFDDVDNEAGVTSGVADQDSWFEADIASAWGLFLDGTANRRDQESDQHGVNVRDYRANTNSFFGGSGTMIQTILQHNCIDTQDDG